MAATTGGDEVRGNLDAKVHAVDELKLNDIVDVEEKGGENKSLDHDEEEPEIVTTRWELWAWYAYYFGNNSAGTLSYAPLSKSFYTFML